MSDRKRMIVLNQSVITDEEAQFAGNVETNWNEMVYQSASPPVTTDKDSAQVYAMNDGSLRMKDQTGTEINLTAGVADAATALAHATGDGSDHADVATNSGHRTGDGSDHANVALNDGHRGGDGSDHAMVAGARAYWEWFEAVAAGAGTTRAFRALRGGTIQEFATETGVVAAAGESMSTDVQINGVSALTTPSIIDDTIVIDTQVFAVVDPAANTFAAGDLIEVVYTYAAGMGPTPMANIFATLAVRSE